MSKKLNAKKKNEKTLASLVKTVKLKEEGDRKQTETDINTMKDSMEKPARTFRLPY